MIRFLRFLVVCLAISITGGCDAQSSQTITESQQFKFVHDISRYGVKWWNPSSVQLHATPPIGVILPKFSGDKQLYGEIRLGDTEDPFFIIALDIFGDRESLHHTDFYLDRNKNRDLSDDGAPIELEPRRSTEIPTFQIPYRNGVSKPYKFRVSNTYMAGRNSYLFSYTRSCGWLGKAKVSAALPEKPVLLLDDNNDGLYGSQNTHKGGVDRFVIDLNDDGFLDASSNGPETFAYFYPFKIGENVYQAQNTSTDGGSIVFEQMTLAALSGKITDEKSRHNIEGASVKGLSLIHISEPTRLQ